MLVVTIVLLGAAGVANADGWSRNWPRSLHEDLRQVALSVHITGDHAGDAVAGAVDSKANEWLSEKLKPFSIRSVRYGKLIAQPNALTDGRTLVVFCKVELKSWQPDAAQAEILIGSVNLYMVRGETRWFDESERTQLFAVKKTNSNLESVILSAVVAQLDETFVLPLTAALEN